MIIARFSHRGYVLFDESKPEFKIESDNATHDMLFEYLNKDFSVLHEPLVRYMSISLDLKTFELTGACAELKDADEIYDLLSDIHSFFKLDRMEENHDALIDAIGYYFSSLLIANYFNGADVVEKSEEWFIERFEALTRCYNLEDDYYEDYFEFYEDAINAEDEVKELLKEAISRGFDPEIYTQNHCKGMLFWIIDISDNPLNKLSTQQREWLYGYIYGQAYSKSYEISVEKRLSLNIKYRNNIDDINPQDINAIHDMRKALDVFYEEYNENEFVAGDFEKTFESVFEELASLIPNNDLLEKENEEYEITNLRQLLFLEVKKMIEGNQQIRRCRNCRMYFVVTNLNQRYCDRSGEDGLLCTDIGSERYFQRKKENDPALSLYLKANNARRMRVSNKIPGWSKERLSNWREEAKAKLELVRCGELNIEEYEKWLKTS